MDGMISCSLINDPVFSYEDICKYSCNTGYELIDSDTRTCQSNGSWNGTDNVCRRGMVHRSWVRYLSTVAVYYVCMYVLGIREMLILYQIYSPWLHSFRKFNI